MQGESGDRCSSPDPPGYDSDEDADEVLSVNLVVPPSHQINELALGLEKQQFGQISFTPGSKNLLNDMLDEVYAQLQPKSTDWDARQTVITFITKFINHKIPGSSISAFGSFVMDLFTSSSDLDLSLNLLDGKCDRSRNDQVHFLRKVAKALYGLQNGQRQSVRGIETVYRAAVPVVKFVECKTGIECDISVENNDGVLKSQVLRMFSTMDSRFRQLCYLVKAWAKKHNVNSSKNGTLNSLSICLLVAFHLQTLPTPIIPPFSVFMEGLHLPAIRSCLETVASRVKDFKDRGFGKDNTESVPELFGSFFLKLIAVENLWEKGLCSSTYEGRWISKIWPKNHIGCISVEDFADRTQNVARSVSRKEFDLIYQALVSTVSNLRDPVSDVLEAKDLKAYLFGSIRQRRRGLDHAELTPFNMGNWQGASSWLSAGERRFHVTKSRVSEPLPDNSQYADQIWGQTGLSPVHFSQFHGQAGRGPGHRAHMYRKVGHSNGVARVDPNFDVIGHGDDRGLHQPQHYERACDYRQQYPRLESRPNPPSDNIKQMPLHAGSGFFSTGAGNSRHRKEEYSGRHRKDNVTTENNSNQSEGGYIHNDVDFPSIGIGYVAVEEPAPVERITYAAVGSRPRMDHSSTPPTVQSNLQQQQSIPHQGAQSLQQQSVQQQSIQQQSMQQQSVQQSTQQQSVQQSIRQQSNQQQNMQQQSIQQSTQQQSLQKQSIQQQSIQQQSFQQQSIQHQSIQQQSIQPQIIQHQSIPQQSIQHHSIPQHSIQQHSFHQHSILQHSDQQHNMQYNQRYRHRNGRRGGWTPQPTVADNAHQYYANSYQIPNGGNVNWQAHPPPSSQFLIS